MSDTASFGVDGDNVNKFIPTAAITTIADALNTRGSGLWNLLRKTGMDRLTIGGNIAGLTDQTRAHGYPVASYGTKKKEQVLSFVKRELQADYTYKYITLNKGDIRRTQRPGALLRYVLQELPNYIVQTIERQITLGGYTDMAHFRSVVTDAADKSSEWKGNRFALSYTMTDDTPLMDFVRASHMVRAQGNKVLLCNADTVADLLMSANANGNAYIALGGDDTLARALGVNQIITLNGGRTRTTPPLWASLWPRLTTRWSVIPLSRRSPTSRCPLTPTSIFRRFTLVAVWTRRSPPWSSSRRLNEVICHDD